MAGNRVLIVDENEAILVVDGELVKKVDEKRGDMSRPEYLNFLIDHQLQPSAEAPIRHEYITRGEFLHFTEMVRDILRNFLEFFLSYGLDLFKPPQEASFQELSQKLQKLADANDTPNKP